MMWIISHVYHSDSSYAQFIGISDKTVLPCIYIQRPEYKYDCAQINIWKKCHQIHVHHTSVPTRLLTFL